MQFCQLDRITELVEGERITAEKELHATELYLKDHFPRFPVMPGVLMLEAMYQASAWLVRKSEDFVHAGVFLKEARNVKYSGFVEPGQMLVITASILKQDDHTVTLKAQGTVNEKPAVSGRLVLEKFNLADRMPGRQGTDKHSINRYRDFFDQLYRPQAQAVQ